MKQRILSRTASRDAFLTQQVVVAEWLRVHPHGRSIRAWREAWLQGEHLNESPEETPPPGDDDPGWERI